MASQLLNRSLVKRSKLVQLKRKGLFRQHDIRDKERPCVVFACGFNDHHPFVTVPGSDCEPFLRTQSSKILAVFFETDLFIGRLSVLPGSPA